MENDINKRKWHRIFGWVTITHPYTDDGSTLVDSEYKHIQQYVVGKGWVDYVGEGKNGNITSIFLNKKELYDQEQKDNIQAAMSYTVKILS